MRLYRAKVRWLNRGGVLYQDDLVVLAATEAESLKRAQEALTQYATEIVEICILGWASKEPPWLVLSSRRVDD